ncbi:MAG: substrate-binding domain-containing protein [Nitrososphaeria archaeon]
MNNFITGTVSSTTTTNTSSEKVLLRLATTTSFDATGLLNALKAKFEDQNPNINLTWVAVGTGQAIEIARRGDVDLVIVHSPRYEEQFLKDGYGVHGVRIAFNDFIIVGPANDPAGLNSTKTVVEAFKRIAEAGAQGKTTFASRADKSGTHTKELEIWKNVGVNASGQGWYKETGQGMAQTLRLANNLQGYTLTDRATWYTLSSELGLKLVFERDPILLNIYRVFLIDPEKYPNLHHSEAERFVLFLVSPETQAFIGNYTKGGQRLFNPLFGRLSEVSIQDPYEDQQVTYWENKLRQ